MTPLPHRDNEKHAKTQIVGWARAVVLCTVSAAAIALLLIATPTQAGIRNSKHDFSNTGNGGIWGSPTAEELCIFCHTPHSARPIEGPTWNRVDGGQVYELYASSSLDAVPGQPTSNSKLCLGCHDGALAVDAYVRGGPDEPELMALGDVYYPGSPYGEAGPNIGGNYGLNNMVNDLKNDHPVSFDYDADLASRDGQLVDPALLSGSLPLYNGRVECATCHDVHDVVSAGNANLLRISNQTSNLCFTCHLK